jgi:hypothetical protein
MTPHSQPDLDARPHPNPPRPSPNVDEPPLPAWAMPPLTRALDDVEGPVPADAIWARLQAQRPPRGAARWARWRPTLRVAALLVCGVAIGRYAVPWMEARARPRPDDRAAPLVVRLDTQVAPLVPARLVLAEHVARTIALLSTVAGNGEPDTLLAPQAHDLLLTTRLLMDANGGRDQQAHRLLMDLELVLVQVMQARPVPAELARAPRETIRQANLIPRLRALIPGTDTLVVNAGGE